MRELAPYAIALLILLLVVATLALLYRRRRERGLDEDPYTRGLECWLAGDLNGAVTAMSDAIARDAGAFDPYLQLGILLRLQGNPRRAAAMHRGLLARPGVPAGKRLSATMALTDDLLDLHLWMEAGEILEAVRRQGAPNARYWEARFRQALGQGDVEGAAKVLYEAARKAGPQRRQSYRERWELFQLDRALVAARAGSSGEARRLLRGIEVDGPRRGRVLLVRGLCDLADGKTDAAASILTEGLLHEPGLGDLFLPPLEKALLESGHFARAVPILESACREPEAPPSLWFTLARLYEKLDDREQAVRLISEKAGDPRLTPDAASRFLRTLIQDLPPSDFGRVWDALHLPGAPAAWICGKCGARHADVRWFCPDCRSFDSLRPESID